MNLELKIKNFKSLLCIRFFVILFSLPILSFSQNELPERPNPPRLVNDFANFLNPQEQNQLERKLVKFNDSTTTQIAIVVVNDLQGYEKSDYATRLGAKWGIGQKGKNNGLLILIKPKNEKVKGEIFIAPGYGLESVIPDAVCKRIIENEIIPRFKENQYYEGLDAATTILMGLAKKEFSASDYNNKHLVKPRSKGGWSPFIIIFVALFFFLIFRISSASSYARTNNVSLWLALWLLMSSSGRGGYYNDFNSGGGFFGGGDGGDSDGGGFGGFGGGDFGGGGAGGSW